MTAVTIYSKDHCPYCTRAKELLTREGIAYVDHDMSQDPEGLNALKEKTGWMTVPQIYIGDEMIGGYDALAKLHAAGELKGLATGVA